MKIRYDPEVDALSITFRETTVTTRDLAEGRLAGLEVLDVGKRFGGRDVLRQVVLEGLGPTGAVR